MNSEKNRLKNILTNDRLTITSDIYDLIAYDINNLLENYFTLLGGSAVKIEPSEKSYLVTIKVEASGIKSFKNLK